MRFSIRIYIKYLFIFQKFTKPIFFDIMKLHNFLESEVRKNEFTRDK